MRVNPGTYGPITWEYKVNESEPPGTYGPITWEYKVNESEPWDLWAHYMGVQG